MRHVDLRVVWPRSLDGKHPHHLLRRPMRMMTKEHGGKVEEVERHPHQYWTHHLVPQNDGTIALRVE